MGIPVPGDELATLEIPAKPQQPEKPTAEEKPKEEKKPFDRSNEVVMERTSSPNIFNLKGDAKALGLEGVKIPTMVLGHSARGATSLQIEIKGKSFDVKDDLKAAGFKWDPVDKIWYHPREMTGESVRRDVATTLKDMKAALQKNPTISLHLVRAR
jgi:hypothetical protein